MIYVLLQFAYVLHTTEEVDKPIHIAEEAQRPQH